MGVKVIRPTYRDKETGKICKYKDYYVQVCRGGKRDLQHVGSREAAYAAKKEIEATIAAGTFKKPEKTPERVITLGEYADKWMTGYVEHNLKWNSKRYYTDMLKRIPDAMKSRPMDEITREDVRNLAFGIVGDNLSRSTATGLIRTISAIFNSAVEDGVYRGANPALKPGRILKMESPEDEESADDSEDIDCMAQEESKHFLSVVKSHFGSEYPLYLTALRTGARQGELIALAWDSIDWKKSFITIKQTVVNGKLQATKNRRRRRIPMSPRLAEVLRERKRAAAVASLASGNPVSRWVFPSPTGGPMDPSKLRKEFKKVLLKAEIRADLTFHSLRRTALTGMADNGVPIASLQRIAGHSSIEVTAKHYLNVKPEDHAGTINALSLLDGEGTARVNPRAERTDGTECKPGANAGIQAGAITN